MYKRQVCANDAVGGRHSPSEIYKNVVEEAAGHNTCVVLMHDTKKETVQALGDIIRWFKNAGYRFDTVAVSYTHLDVYKRQHVWSTALSSCIPKATPYL